VEEEPRQPDLSKIFPAGAERATREGAPAMPAMPPPPPGPRTPASGEPIAGSVRVAAELAGRVRDDAVLFVIARSGSAGPPLAVKRINTPRFPVEFVIGPEDRMIQAMPFAGPLRVSARLDRDGNATTRSPGDLQGAAPEPVATGSSGVEIVLDEAL
jgi:cytochrome c-type biogenesis protein CcmH